MPVLFFLPWVRCTTPIELDEVRLVPYVRRKQPGQLGIVTQEMIDAVLSRYGDRKYGINRDTAHPITSACMFVWDGDYRDGAPELSEDEIQSRLSFGQAFAFAAVANRQYRSHVQYCNADTLAFVAQPFTTAAPSNVSVYSRRRDGAAYNMIGTSAGLPVFMRPAHVEAHPRIDYDDRLLRALLSEIKAVTSSVSDAIALFLRANTDAIEVPVSAEIVMLRAAFESLLDATHKTPSLRAAINTHFSHDLSDPKWASGDLNEAAWRARWPKNVERPLDAWIQDFCAARNANAHGPRAEQTETVWSVHEHMLFGSWLFPLVVKGVLATQGVYEMSWLDRHFRREFERFFAHRLFASAKRGEINWTGVERDLRFDDIARRMYPY